jgi:hypothetical protein
MAPGIRFIPKAMDQYDGRFTLTCGIIIKEGFSIAL